MGSVDGSWPRSTRAAVATAGALAAAAAATAAAVTWRRRRAGVSGKNVSSSKSIVGRRGRVSWAEVAKHNQVDNAWIVIHDEAYDVTQWMGDHPGGKFLLLAHAGRDATEPFETIGHSPLARRELRRWHIGSVMRDGSSVSVDPASPALFGRKAELTGGRKASSDHPSEDTSIWQVGENGFLPTRDPVGIEALCGTPFEVFAELADLLPSMAITGELRQHLDGDADLQARLSSCGDEAALNGLTEEQLERAFCVVGYTMVIYWRGGTLAYSQGLSNSSSGLPTATVTSGGSCGTSNNEPSTLPGFLARPMLALSQRLGRPPMPDYVATVLYNWVRIDPDGPISTTNIRCALRFTALLDEDWFFKTHVVIESEAAHAVAAIIGASRTEDDVQLLQCLVALEEALWRVVRACLPIMYERSEDGLPKCSEHIFYQILRPLIKSEKMTFEADSGPQLFELTGPSGAMSSILPAIDAALGIQTTSKKLRTAISNFELSMPQSHRTFLQELRSRLSIRQRILLTRGPAGEVSESHEALVRAYNRCIARVLDFRWQHWQYVKSFIMKPANMSHCVGTGGSGFDYLQQHITDTEQARLAERFSNFQRASSSGTLSPDLRPAMPIRLPPPVSYHQPQEYWSVDGERGLLSREPLTGPSGAWAQELSPALRTAVEVLWDTAKRMPALVVAEGPFYQHVEALKDKLGVLQDEHLVANLSEVAREHLMTVLSHITAGCIGSRGHRKPPRCIDRPLQVVARSVGRPARVDFTELVLCNWNVVRPANGDKDQEQLAIVFRFLSIPDEECYRTLHILLHKEARDVVAAIRVGQVAMREQSNYEVASSVSKLSVWLNKFCDFFDAYFEQKDSRTESVMIRRLEPFISHSSAHDLTWEETACWVYWSGSSAILPAVHLFLGVRMSASVSTGSAEEAQRLGKYMSQMLEEMRVSMPLLHRAFLDELAKPGCSVRHYCLRRFGAKSVPVEVLHELEAAYNEALNALTRFLSRRMHLVLRLFPQLASPFGAFHSEVEAAMRRNRLQLLRMRQRVDRCLEK